MFAPPGACVWGPLSVAPPGACVWGPLSGPRGCDCGGRARSFGVGGRRFVQHGRMVADAGVPRCARTGAARL
jgi:hypothetical protein